MKKILKVLACIVLFLIGWAAAFLMLTGALTVWLKMETLDAVLWSIVPSLIIGAWCASTTKTKEL